VPARAFSLRCTMRAPRMVANRREMDENGGGIGVSKSEK
jgi:hypothetical protein